MNLRSLVAPAAMLAVVGCGATEGAVEEAENTASEGVDKAPEATDDVGRTSEALNFRPTWISKSNLGSGIIVTGDTPGSYPVCRLAGVSDPIYTLQPGKYFDGTCRVQWGPSPTSSTKVYESPNNFGLLQRLTGSGQYQWVDLRNIQTSSTGFPTEATNYVYGGQPSTSNASNMAICEAYWNNEWSPGKLWVDHGFTYCSFEWGDKPQKVSLSIQNAPPIRVLIACGTGGNAC